MSWLAALFGEKEQGYRRISGREARELLRTGATLVDVRTEGEYRAQRIPGSTLIPNPVISQRVPALLPDRAAPIIVHCQSGIRSRMAAKQLLALGYTQVYDLGGIGSWPDELVSG